MSTVTLTLGHIANGNEVLCNVQSPRPPFSKGACVIAEEYLVGTDFTSGDDLVLEFPGIDKIVYASAVSNVGAVKAFAEAADSTGTGRKLTFSAVTTNLKVFIITDV